MSFTDQFQSVVKGMINTILPNLDRQVLHAGLFVYLFINFFWGCTNFGCPKKTLLEPATSGTTPALYKLNYLAPKLWRSSCLVNIFFFSVGGNGQKQLFCCCCCFCCCFCLKANITELNLFDIPIG